MSNAVRWSEDQLSAHQKRISDKSPPMAPRPVRPTSDSAFRSKWEAQYAQQLRFRVLGGDIKTWGYEAITLLLAGRVRYTPDFAIQPLEGQLQLHEVKGRMREGARIKLRAAIEKFPFFDFYLVGEDMTPKRMATPGDVPATTR